MRLARLLAPLPFALAAASAPAPGPALRTAAREADLGDIPAGERPGRAFLITSACDAPVAIGALRHAGLVVEGLPARLEPGGQATVVLRAEEPVDGPGEFSLPADFSVEPARCGPLTLEIHGRVLQYFISEPPNLQARLELAPGAGGEISLRLARKDGAPANVGAVFAEPFGEGAERLAGRLEVRGAAAPDGSWRGALTVRPLAEPGLYFARLRFPTDHPRQKQVTITVLVRNLPPLEFFPAEVRFHLPLSRARLAAGPPPVRRLFVRAPPGRVAFAPGALRAEPSFVRVRWAAAAPGEALKGESVIEVSLAPDAPAGEFAGKIYVARSALPGDESAVAVSGRVDP